MQVITGTFGKQNDSSLPIDKIFILFAVKILFKCYNFILRFSRKLLLNQGNDFLRCFGDSNAVFRIKPDFGLCITACNRFFCINLILSALIYTSRFFALLLFLSSGHVSLIKSIWFPSFRSVTILLFHSLRLPLYSRAYFFHGYIIPHQRLLYKLSEAFPVFPGSHRRSSYRTHWVTYSIASSY